MGPCIYCFVRHVTEEELRLYSTRLNFYEKREKRIHDITFLNGSLPRLIVQKRIAVGACDDEKTQNIVIWLSSVVQVIQYVKRLYIDLHYVLIFY